MIFPVSMCCFVDCHVGHDVRNPRGFLQGLQQSPCNPGGLSSLALVMTIHSFGGVLRLGGLTWIVIYKMTYGDLKGYTPET